MTSAAAEGRLRIGVVGSGVVGAAAALQAERLGADVWLFEPHPSAGRSPVPGPDQLADWPNRHVALSPRSLDFLHDLGVPCTFLHGRIERMAVWEQLGTAALDFAGQDVSAPTLALMAEVPDLVAVLWEQVRSRSAIHCVTEGIAGLQRQSNRWVLTADAASYEVDWVLAADGARSAVRSQLGLSADARPTGHSALATVVRTREPHGCVARQRFLIEGPLALLPTREPSVVSVVWSQPPARAAARLELTETQFCDALTVASEAVLGPVEAAGPRGAFPIVELLANDFAPRPGLAFIGDAAHVIHPLAGLGVNLGLEDVIALRPVLTAALAGAVDPWPAWRRQRRARSLVVQRALGALQLIYGQDAPLLSWVRNWGVRAVNGAGPLRRALIREAMGL